MKKKIMKRNISKNHYNFQEPPIKVMDGFYIGEQDVAKDFDFIHQTKTTHIINTVNHSIPNYWENYGIKYLSFSWTEKQQNILSVKKNQIDQCIIFIDNALNNGEGILIHSVHGKSRASLIAIAYLMKKYKWGLTKCLDYFTKKKKQFQIDHNFMNQLDQFEREFSRNHTLSTNWQDYVNQEDRVMANTYNNMKIIHHQQQKLKQNHKKRVNWDDCSGKYSNNESIHRTNLNKNSILSLKSILKGFKNDNQSDFSDELKESLQFQTKYNEKQHLQNFLENSSYHQGKYFIQKHKMKEKDNFQTLQQKYFSQDDDDLDIKLIKSQTFQKNSKQTHNNPIKSVKKNNYVSFSDQNSCTSASRYSSIPARMKIHQNKQQKGHSNSGNRLMPYQNVISSLKTPYDQNFINKNSITSSTKKRDQFRGTTSQQKSTTIKSLNIGTNTKQNLNKRFGAFSQMSGPNKKDILEKMNQHRNTWNINTRENLLKDYTK